MNTSLTPARMARLRAIVLPLAAAIAASAAVSAIVAASFTHLRSTSGATAPQQDGASPVLKLAEANAMLTAATAGQAKAFAVFPGPSGLTGALVGNANPDAPGGDQRLIAWIDRSGDVMVGSLLAPNGANFTMAAIDAFTRRGVDVAPAGLGAAQPLATSAPTPGGISSAQPLPSGLASIGPRRVAGRPELTVFFDPDCLYCHVLWQNLQDASLRGKIAVRWIPVGIVRADSTARAATVLQGGVAALEANETRFDGATETGGAAPSTDVNAINSVRRNTLAFMGWARANNLPVVTPTLIWRAPSGTLNALSGAQTSDFLRHALGVH